MHERECALEVLRDIERHGSFAQLAIEARTASSGDAGLVRALVFAVLRWRSTLDFVISHLSDRKLTSIDSLTLDVLRIGIAQIAFLDRIAPWAAVNETVSLAARRVPRSKGFVNAVLRRAARTDVRALLPSGSSPADIAVRTGHPEWMIRRWARRFGAERTERFATANQELSHPDLYVNLARTTVDEIGEELSSRGIEWERSARVESMIRMKGSTSGLGDLIQRGLVYPMDEGSALVASLVPAGCSPVLDLAAAPGGKSLVLRSRGLRVVSADASPGRLRSLERTMRQWFGEPPEIVAADALHPPFARRFGAVLLDAPCSATGTIRRNPELKWRLTEGRIRELAAQQKAMLTAALEVAGICVYATCSLEAEENEDVVAGVSGGPGGWRTVEIPGSRGGEPLEAPAPSGMRLFPDGGTDGFTAFVLTQERDTDGNKRIESR